MARSDRSGRVTHTSRSGSENRWVGVPRDSRTVRVTQSPQSSHAAIQWRPVWQSRECALDE
jgi:hypothetical protein